MEISKNKNTHEIIVENNIGSSASIVFIQGYSNIPGFPYSYFAEKYANIKLELRESRFIDSIIKIDSYFLNKVVELKLCYYALRIPFAGLFEMKNLRSLWLYTTQTIHLEACIKNNGDVKCIEKIYMDFNIAEKYLSAWSNISTYIKPTSVFVILMGQLINKLHIKTKACSMHETEFNFNFIKSTVDIVFGINQQMVIEPEGMNEIMHSIYNWNILKHTIRIKYIAKNTAEVDAVQIPLYYYINSTKIHEAFLDSNIFVDVGPTSTKMQFKDFLAPSLHTKKDIPRYFPIIMSIDMLRKCKPISKLNKINQILKSLINQKKNNKTQCMHCKKNLLNDSMFLNRTIIIMVYGCKHISCAPCGYAHLSKTFGCAPKCMVCFKKLISVKYNILLEDKIDSSLLYNYMCTAFGIPEGDFIFTHVLTNLTPTPLLNSRKKKPSCIY